MLFGLKILKFCWMVIKRTSTSYLGWCLDWIILFSDRTTKAWSTEPCWGQFWIVLCICVKKVRPPLSSSSCLSWFSAFGETQCLTNQHNHWIRGSQKLGGGKNKKPTNKSTNFYNTVIRPLYIWKFIRFVTKSTNWEGSRIPCFQQNPPTKKKPTKPPWSYP